MKKTILLSTLLLGAGLMVGCANGLSNSNGLTVSGTKMEFNDLYSYSAISSIAMLNQLPGNTLRARNPLTDQEKDKILKNFELVEGFMNNQVVKSEETTSSIEGYQTMYTITLTSSDGTKNIYEYHYNEIVTEVEHDEVESILNGIVIHGDITYKMWGEKEIEQDEEELSFKISLDDNTFVEIEQEKENNEQGFEYTLYQNRREVYSTEIEYEIERGKVKFKFEEETLEGEREYEYIITERDGETVILVEIEENNQEDQLMFKIIDNNGVREYIFIE